MYYEVYQGLIYDNLVQAESETGVPEQLVQYSYQTKHYVKWCGKKYLFVDFLDKIHYAE